MRTATSPRRALCGALLSLGLLACTDEPTERPRGVVLLLLDTVRADHVSAYGYGRETTPALDALTAEGTLFENVVAAAPWTLPSVAGLLAGTSPGLALDDRNQLASSLVERLAESGVRTAAITEGGFVSEYFGFDRGFESFTEELGPVRLLEPDEVPPKPEETAGTAARVFARAQRWLEENDEPFFLLVHTYEPHTPYTAGTFAAGMDPGRIKDAFKITHLIGLREGRIEMTPAEQRYGVALYDGDIHATDRHVGELLAFLEQHGMADTTAVVATSDHGEELGEAYETGFFDHGHSLRDNLLLVPLVLRVPWREGDPARVSTQVRLIDVMPTVCELLGVPAGDTRGESLLPVLDGAEREHRLVFSSETKRGPARISVRDGRYKLIRVVGAAPGDDVHKTLPDDVPEVQLYDLAADPTESQNLADARPRLVEALSAVLDEWYRAVGRSSADQVEVEDDALRARLESLGYGG